MWQIHKGLFLAGFAVFQLQRSFYGFYGIKNTKPKLDDVRMDFGLPTKKFFFEKKFSSGEGSFLFFLTKRDWIYF